MWSCPGKGLPVFSEYSSRSQLLTTDKTSLCIWRHAQSVLAQSMPIEVNITKPSHASLTVTEKPEESLLANALNLSTGPLSLPFPALEAVLQQHVHFITSHWDRLAGWPCRCGYLSVLPNSSALFPWASHSKRLFCWAYEESHAWRDH